MTLCSWATTSMLYKVCGPDGAVSDDMTLGGDVDDGMGVQEEIADLM